MVSVGAAAPYRSYWSRSIENLETELAEPLPERPAFDEPIENVRARIAQRVGRVRFERNLAAGHILVRDLLAEDEKRRKRRNEPPWGYSRPEPLFESGFERHRLRILSSLFLALQKFGAPSLRGETGRELSLSVGVETVRFTLDHPDAKADRNGNWKTWPGTIDILRLSIEGAGARTWLDTEEDRLETYLDEVVVHLIVAGELNYRARADASYEHAVSRRREVQQELEKARAEARRKEREARIAQERERRKVLLGMAADLRAADDIRTLVRRISEAHVDPETEPARQWGRWALEVADRLDPTGRLRFDTGGRGRLHDPDWPDPDDLATPSGDGGSADLCDEADEDF
jgi:hypothetical protein